LPAVDAARLTLLAALETTDFVAFATFLIARLILLSLPMFKCC